MTAKEDCFKDAAEAYQDATGKDLGLEFQKPWRLLENGTWERTTNWWSALNSFFSGKAEQLRRPDLTIGGQKVFDLKFTRADGTVDTWGTRPGAGNGETQRHDYNQINKQNSPDMKNDDPKLDPETCNCKGRGAKAVEVPVAVPGLSPYGVPFIPLPAPGGMPLPAMPGLPAFPGFGPMPLPVPSSRAYKEEISAEADLGAERLLALKVRRFRWRHGGPEDLGLIAEEVRETLPELFHDSEGVTGLRAADLPFYLLQLLQGQQAQIAALTARLAALEGRADD